MKITRRQLRQIINETLSLNEVAPLAAIGAITGTAAAGLAPPAVVSTKLVAIYQGGHAALENLKAKKAGTQKFTLDVIRRAASKTLKKIKGDLTDDEIEKLHKAIMSGAPEELAANAKSGLMPLDVRELNSTFQGMKSSASVETVDLDAVEEILGDLRASVT